MRKIMIIEDDLDVIKVLHKRLTQQDFEVMVAQDAYQGIALIHKNIPDLIILDLMLPAGGGQAVLKNIKLSNQVKYIPIIVLTGVTDPEYKKKVLSDGVDAYIEKPYDPDNLMATINGLLNKPRIE
jgi:DNA-binding response OmpR family regulator